MSNQMNHIFQFKPRDFTAQFDRDGWVLIENGVSQQFLADATEQLLENTKSKQTELTEWAVTKKKQQFLFDFGYADGMYDEVRHTVAAVCGLDRQNMTICERHVKVYDSAANPHPVPHKDRLASEVAVGIPLRVSASSYLAIYADQDRQINPFQTAAEWRDHLPENQRPEHQLAGVEPTKVYCKRGDVVMFRGSALYHERVHAANTMILFLKLNSMRLDPLGEDPLTHEADRMTEELLAELNRGSVDLPALFVETSPRLEKVIRYYSRHDWEEVLLANLWSQSPTVISEFEFQLLKACDKRANVGTIASRLAMQSDSDCWSAVLRLAQEKLVNLSR